MEKSETKAPNDEPTRLDNSQTNSRRYIADEEAIYERAEYIFKLTDSLIFILLASMSGGIIGFFFAGAFNIAASSFVAMILGLLMGFALWGNKSKKNT